VTALNGPLQASVSPTAVYVVDAHGRLAALRVDTGEPLWAYDFTLSGDEVATSYWSPVNDGGTVYAVVYHFMANGADFRHRYELLAVAARTGALASRLDIDFEFMHGAEPLMLSGDHVYFAALEGLFAFGVVGGSENCRTGVRICGCG
jgi:outer membrane protein assembly factor BamB